LLPITIVSVGPLRHIHIHYRYVMWCKQHLSQNRIQLAITQSRHSSALSWPVRHVCHGLLKYQTVVFPSHIVTRPVAPCVFTSSDFTWVFLPERDYKHARISRCKYLGLSSSKATQAPEWPCAESGVNYIHAFRRGVLTVARWPSH
jgi:hypothetical protein